MNTQLYEQGCRGFILVLTSALALLFNCEFINNTRFALSDGYDWKIEFSPVRFSAHTLWARYGAPGIGPRL